MLDHALWLHIRKGPSSSRFAAAAMNDVYAFVYKHEPGTEGRDRAEGRDQVNKAKCKVRNMGQDNPKYRQGRKWIENSSEEKDLGSCWKEFFPVTVVRYWKRFSREVVDATSLEVFKAMLDAALATWSREENPDFCPGLDVDKVMIDSGIMGSKPILKIHPKQKPGGTTTPNGAHTYLDLFAKQMLSKSRENLGGFKGKPVNCQTLAGKDFESQQTFDDPGSHFEFATKPEGTKRRQDGMDWGAERGPVLPLELEWLD
ncbi:hypothetical protein WISP_28297 [Willisornis vidua]|uniref:Uncharacterized protein n=1 Tax=Willisornis vidua TaxID=1566151 RepID=A0ABQ9DS95_9PASS|nr:hypothetical protein WISP_28297 [Willisornis vidua]